MLKNSTLEQDLKSVYECKIKSLRMEKDNLLKAKENAKNSKIQSIWLFILFLIDLICLSINVNLNLHAITIVGPSIMAVVLSSCFALTTSNYVKNNKISKRKSIDELENQILEDENKLKSILENEINLKNTKKEIQEKTNEDFTSEINYSLNNTTNNNIENNLDSNNLKDEEKGFQKVMKLKGNK